jgi:hypothetical protein
MNNVKCKIAGFEWNTFDSKFHEEALKDYHDKNKSIV